MISFFLFREYIHFNTCPRMAAIFTKHSAGACWRNEAPAGNGSLEAIFIEYPTICCSFPIVAELLCEYPPSAIPEKGQRAFSRSCKEVSSAHNSGCSRW